MLRSSTTRISGRSRLLLRKKPFLVLPRRYASGGNGNSQAGRLSSTFFNLLLLGGLAGVGYGVYDMYLKPLQWPDEVQGDLRAGIRAKHEGDLVTAQSYFERAWLTAKSIPPSSFSPYPYLKITGIALALSSIQDALSNHEGSYTTLASVHAFLQTPHVQQDLSALEKMRSIAICHRLGEMSAEMGKPLGEQEKWLVGAVNELLRLVKEESTAGEQVEDAVGMEGALGMISELDLPVWMDKESFGAPFEALGEFYSRLGKVEYAMPLYLQAISILIPPPPHQARSDEDICRGAQLMSNISELLIRHDKSSERLAQAAMWASRGLAKIQTVMKNDPAYVSSLNVPPSNIDSDDLDTTVRSAVPSTCETALIFSLFNNGAIAEYQSDAEKAKGLYEQSLHQAKRVGMKEGVKEAERALERLERGEVLPATSTPPPSSSSTGWGGWVRGLFVGRG